VSAAVGAPTGVSNPYAEGRDYSERLYCRGTRRFDLFDLLLDEVQASHVAPQLGERIRRLRSIKIACLSLVLNQCCSETPLQIFFQQHRPKAELVMGVELSP
jgi:hypothetical protein